MLRCIKHKLCFCSLVIPWLYNDKEDVRKVLILYFSVFLYIFRDDIEKAKSSGDWKAVHDFYSTTFDSFLEINAVFKVKNSKYYSVVIVMWIFKAFKETSVKGLQLATQTHLDHGTDLFIPVYVRIFQTNVKL